MLETEGGVDGNNESSFKETLKVAVVPSSAVLPEMLVMLKFSLPDTKGATGAGPAGDESRATLNVAALPPSLVLPEILVISKKSLPDTEGAEGAARAGF